MTIKICKIVGYIDVNTII